MFLMLISYDWCLMISKSFKTHVNIQILNIWDLIDSAGKTE